MPKFIQFFQSMDKNEISGEFHEMQELHEGMQSEPAVNYDYLHPNFTNE